MAAAAAAAAAAARKRRGVMQRLCHSRDASQTLTKRRRVIDLKRKTVLGG